MGNSQTRPRPGPPPRTDEPIEILRELLQVERDRLVVAQRIENERSIVFPETTVIIRDIHKLVMAIEKREAGDTDAADTPWAMLGLGES